MGVHHHGPALLELEASRSEQGTTVMPVGELDVATAGRLEAVLRQAAQDTQGAITLDLSKLRFIDVTGARTILEAARTLGERLSVVPGPPHVQRVFEITGVDRKLSFISFDNVMPFPGAAERNLKYVRRIWKALVEDGIDAFVQLVPPDVEWLPWPSSNQVLRGSDELRAFCLAHGYGSPGTPNEFSSLGDNVLVRMNIELISGSARDVFLLYEFQQGTLRRAASFDRAADARPSLS